jgi:hypothetical protein
VGSGKGRGYGAGDGAGGGYSDGRQLLLPLESFIDSVHS